MREPNHERQQRKLSALIRAGWAEEEEGGQQQEELTAVLAEAMSRHAEWFRLHPEAAAQAAGPINVYATTFRSMRESFGGGQEKSLLKLITDADTDKVIGCHIVAPAAGEMIQLIGVAIKMGATKADFDRTMAVHPTLSEELVTMGGPVRMG